MSGTEDKKSGLKIAAGKVYAALPSKAQLRSAYETAKPHTQRGLRYTINAVKETGYKVSAPLDTWRLNRITRKLGIDQQTPLGIAQMQNEFTQAHASAQRKVNGGRWIKRIGFVAVATLAVSNLDKATEYMNENGGLLGVYHIHDKKFRDFAASLKFDEAAAQLMEYASDAYTDQILAGENCSLDEYKAQPPLVDSGEGFFYGQAFNKESCLWEMDRRNVSEERETYLRQAQCLSDMPESPNDGKAYVIDTVNCSWEEEPKSQASVSTPDFT